MEMATSTKHQKEAKKFYSSPKLVRHGDMRFLTRAGASAMMENAGNQNRTKP